MDDAERDSFAYERHSQNGGGPSHAAGSFNDLRIFRGGDEPDVFNLDNFPVQHGSAWRRLAIDRSLYSNIRHRSVVRCQSHDVSIDQPQDAIFRTTYACGAFCNGLQHRLNIRRRAGDDA